MPKQNVKCEVCNKDLKRWLINPITKNPIKNFFCDNNCKGVWQVKQREKLGFTKEWLVDEYINKNKSSDQIAREIKRDAKRVWEWLKYYNIPTRSRGTDYGQLFVKGHKLMLGFKHSDETKKIMSDISIKDKRVPWGKNNVHPFKGKKGIEVHSFKGGLTPERQAFYSSVEWVEAVKKVWKRDKAICQRCKKLHNNENRGTFHIHHIISFQKREFRAELENLVLLCKECHRWVHSNQNINKDFIKEI